MAIKVASDTVINNSKELQNIASLDATTIAAVKANGGPSGTNDFKIAAFDTSAVENAGTFTDKVSYSGNRTYAGSGLYNAAPVYNTTANDKATGSVVLENANVGGTYSFTLTLNGVSLATDSITYNTNASFNRGTTFNFTSTVTSSHVSARTGGADSFSVNYASNSGDATFRFATNASSGAEPGVYADSAI